MPIYSHGPYGLPEGYLGNNINLVVSQSSGAFTSSSSSVTAVTNLSCNIQTSGDYPVEIRMMPDGNSSNDAQLGLHNLASLQSISGSVRLLRDGNNIGTFDLQYSINGGTGSPNSQVMYVTPNVYFLDFPPKGNHTYSISVISGNNTNLEVLVKYMVLVVYENRSMIYK